MPLTDPYAALGVARDASADKIKDAYRKLAKKLHPDLNPGNVEAEKKFKEIAAAYEIVGDAANRAKFDRGEWDMPENGGQGGTQSGGFRGRQGPFYREAHAGGGRYDFGGGGAGFDESIFEQFFGGRGAGQPFGEAARGPREELYQMEVDLRDSILGAEKDINLPSGKRLQVKIPAGVAEGSRLRFSGQAAGGGDILVEIRLREDPRFRREGRNLQMDLPVSLVDAVLGGEVRVPTPEGGVALKIPAGSQAGRRFRLPGKGVKEKGQPERGDLFVRIQIELPDDPELKAWAERRRGGEGNRDAKGGSV